MSDTREPIRVLIVDDSAMVRELLSAMLATDPGIRVVGTAADAYAARDKIKALAPDVLTLDVEMPRMDGLQFLRNLMRLRPMPVIMCSSLTERGADITLEALELGAVDFVTKPRLDVAHTLRDYTHELVEKVKSAARARVRPRTETANMVAPAAAATPQRTTQRLVAIGASTGGTEAIRELLARLPADSPTLVIAQHMPSAFGAAFVRRLCACSAVRVLLAEDGQTLLAGHAYVAPGDRHLTIVRDGSRYRCRLLDHDPHIEHRPSVDLLFRSVAACAGRNALGALLTGMGNDGAQGLLALREAGGRTVIQDRSTSVVWEMPGTAADLGAAELVLPLSAIATEIIDWAAQNRH
jgi:two-component system chemotaxis response regulator CheB